MIAHILPSLFRDVRRRNESVILVFFGLAFILSLTSAARAQDSASPTTAIPATTTQERQVNPTGLSEAAPDGWHPDFIGPFRGDFDVSFGVKAWTDRFLLRNLIFGGTVDLAPGVRLHGLFQRRDGENRFFTPDTDEFYLEAFNQYRGHQGNAGIDLRLGRSRYLHFPYPDAIAQFDTVPNPIVAGVADVNETDYRDVTLQGEASLNSGWGVHWTGLAGDRQRLLAGPTGFTAEVLEAYAFYRSDFGRGWHAEGRAGDLAVRTFPLARGGEPGYNVYLGKKLGEFNIGVLYERKQNEHEYTGLMVQFRPGPVTRALGHVDFDYQRDPEGFSAQIPLLHARLNESRFVHSGDELVGEVRAVRMRTIWGGGLVRNQYEHRLESWGETADPKLHCVVTEEPWYVQTEALVSPHLAPDARWISDRQGPGQFVQRVTYRYYRPKLKPEDRNRS